VCVCDVVE